MRPGDRVRISAPREEFDARLVGFRPLAMLKYEARGIAMELLAIQDADGNWIELFRAPAGTFLCGRDLIISAARAAKGAR